MEAILGGRWPAGNSRSLTMGKKTKEEEADGVELEEEEEEDVEMEEEGVDEEVDEAQGEEDEEDEGTDEDEDEEESTKAAGVDVRDSKLAGGMPAATFNTFMQDVWPILKKNGWEKVGYRSRC
jgi:hypothetical protein